MTHTHTPSTMLGPGNGKLQDLREDRKMTDRFKAKQTHRQTITKHCGNVKIESSKHPPGAQRSSLSLDHAHKGIPGEGVS